MSFSERIHECNAFDLDHFLPFHVDGRTVGHVPRERTQTLAKFKDVFHLTGDAVALSPGIAGEEARTAALDEVVRTLSAEGHVPPLREEPFAVFADPSNPDFTGEPLMTLDRCAVKFFGLPAWGLHLNGYVRGRDGKIRIWIARRSMDRQVHPGKLDNMVAGGQPYGISLHDNLLKESAEEAALTPDLLQDVEDAGTISYCVETPEGLSPATMFVFDIALPEDFTPRPVDGEIDEFLLMTPEEVARLTAQTYQFKPNTCLVNMDFLLRHGLFEGSEAKKERLRRLIRRK